MNNSYYERYSHYSNLELIRIIEYASDYQPLAVETAKTILTERNISEREMSVEISKLIEEKENLRIKKEKSENIKNSIIDLFKPFIHPQEKLDYRKWFHILCIYLLAYYLYSIIFQTNTYTNSVILTIITYTYIPIFIILIILKKKIGWVLLMFNSIFIIHARLFSCFFIIYMNQEQVDWSIIIMPIVYYAILISIQLKDEVKTLFNISQTLKKRTILYSLIIGLIYLISGTTLMLIME